MVGIDDMSFYVPGIYLPIETLAKARNIEYAKLNKGLGLKKMALPDVGEDAATMAAMALHQLIDRNHLDPTSIGRIYMGTESALDGAKPTASYALGMLAQRYGEHAFRNCDVVDMTFACIGGMDALHNTIDWVKGDPKRIGIVVATDFAKYDLESTGEYTQGAGAVAMLIKHQPRLLAIDDSWGVATESVFDFFKPRRRHQLTSIVNDALDLYGKTAFDLELKETIEKHGKGILSTDESFVEQFKETPVFDGQYSNQCYQDRIHESTLHFTAQKSERNILEDWNHFIFHLPYAAHGRRIFIPVFIREMEKLGHLDVLITETGIDPKEDKKGFEKAVAKCPTYLQFVATKVEKSMRASSQIGNMYTASIFMALMSAFSCHYRENSTIEGELIGLIGYGSGSKSKVCEAKIQPNWKSVVEQWNLFESLENRQAISFDEYLQLHKQELLNPILPKNDKVYLDKIGDSGVTEGARYYSWKKEPSI